MIILSNTHRCSIVFITLRCFSCTWLVLLSDASDIHFYLEGQQCISLLGTPCCHEPGYLQVQDHSHEVKCLSAWRLLEPTLWQLKKLGHPASLVLQCTFHKDVLEIFRFPCQSLLLVLFVRSLHRIRLCPWKLLGTTCTHCTWKLPSKSPLWGSFHQPPS